MSDVSLIEWCMATWNFLIGCTKKSAGCMHCYAIRVAWRMMHNPNPKIAKKFAGTVARDSKGELNWTGRINFDDEVILKPLSWKLPRRVFVNSLSDLFHKNVKDEWLDRAFAVMSLCPQHTFQILTKEPERMLAYFSDPYHMNRARSWVYSIDGHRARHEAAASWPLPNVWLGVSVEDQKTADERIPLLLETPAAVRWISAEPLLGPIEFSDVTKRSDAVRRLGKGSLDGVRWIVCGGESGPKARPMHPDWARSLRDQCVAAGVPYFFKQWGEWVPSDQFSIRNDEELDLLVKCDTGKYGEHLWWKEVQNGSINTYTSYRVGKKAAGRLLDGREWSEYPEAKAVTA